VAGYSAIGKKSASFRTIHDIVDYQVSDLISETIMTVNKASDWLIHNLGTVNIISVDKLELLYRHR